MASGGLIAALVGAGGAVALVVLARRSQAAAGADDGPGGGAAGKSPCDYLKGVDEAAYASCLALQGGISVIGGIVDMLPSGPGDEFRAKDAKNRELNGKVKTPLVQQVRTCLDTSNGHPAANGASSYVPLWGTVLEFENGCTPFEGSPGWSKCAPGTADMMVGESYINKNASNYDPVTRTVNWEMRGPSSHVMTGDRYRDGDKLVVDAASGRYIGGAAGGNCAAKTPFPLPIPEGGEGWFYKGRPFVVPAGAWPDFDILDESGLPTLRGLGGVTDHRGEDAAEWLDNHMGPTTSGVVKCYDFLDREVACNAQQSTNQQSVDCNNTPGYIWDPQGFCRRRKVGE